LLVNVGFVEGFEYRYMTQDNNDSRNFIDEFKLHELGTYL